MLKLILTVTVIFFLSGCNDPQLSYKDRIVEKPKPKFKILNKVEFYEIQDYRKFDETYWLINMKEFDIASDRIKKKDYKIRFYEKWGTKYNKEFYDRNTSIDP